MIEALSKLGFGGLIGFLLGLVAVWWVEPTTSGGVALLLLIFVIVGVVLFTSYKAVVILFKGNNNVPSAQLPASKPLKAVQTNSAVCDLNGEGIDQGKSARFELISGSVGENIKSQKESLDSQFKCDTEVGREGLYWGLEPEAFSRC